jgi:hypothetical protein
MITKPIDMSNTILKMNIAVLGVDFLIALILFLSRSELEIDLIFFI